MLDGWAGGKGKFAVLPTVGGQTALNLAVDLADSGVLEKYGVELIGAKLEAIKKAEDRLLFKDAMTQDRAGYAAVAAGEQYARRAGVCGEDRISGGDPAVALRWVGRAAALRTTAKS